MLRQRAARACALAAPAREAPLGVCVPPWYPPSHRCPLQLAFGALGRGGAAEGEEISCHHAVLRRLGDRPQLHHREGHGLHDAVGGGQPAAEGGKDHLGPSVRTPDTTGHSGPANDAVSVGAMTSVSPIEPRRSAEIHDRDRDDEHDGEQQQCTAGLPWLPRRMPRCPARRCVDGRHRRRCARGARARGAQDSLNGLRRAEAAQWREGDEGMYDTTLAAENAAAAVDARGVVAAWSRGARLLLGYEPGEAIGRQASDLLAARLPDSAWRSLSQQEPWTGRIALCDRDGHTIEAEVRAYPLVGADDHVGWFVHAAPQEADGADLALQRRLLLYHRPAQPAVETAMRYLPADPRAGVGGDWFDVVPLSGARVALVVGDVVGHGINASATMGQLRSAIRTLADVDLPPDELLTQLDDLILEEIEEGIESTGEVGATCLYAVYDPVSRDCTLASAGHPAPAAVLPDGSVDFLPVVPGPPLGVGGLPFEATNVRLPEGSLLVLYTDGLIEARDRDIDAGMHELAHALADPAPSLDATCDHVMTALLPERPDDDVALLVARTHAFGSAHVVTWDLPAAPVIVADARRRAADQLTTWGLQEAVATTELIVSELVTNAIRHAEAPIRLRLIRNTTLICEVSDASSTAPHPRRAHALDEGGRGLFLVGQVAERWGTRHTPTGKTIWAEQPRTVHTPRPGHLPAGRPHPAAQGLGTRDIQHEHPGWPTDVLDPARPTVR
ncbi:MAG: SpoIIE family protein phosphatase [Streptomyces sp.]|nr:SpoIIE family protein phosphatase [Streptomyces sp.]